MMYELLYIIPTRFTDAEIEGIQGTVRGLIEKAGAKVVKEENLGRIRLAYPIKQTRHGSYILAYLEAETSVVAEIENQLRLATEVLRHMLVQLPKGVPERSFLLESYVAPLSEEEEEIRRPHRAAEAAPVKPAEVTETEPVLRDEKPLSMEDLDKKLDEILDVNTSENI
ncbi:MAG: 30S ribosomal protein S6 [Patescibacteria group bacterium]|jgi:small subunit ribosomal protein S6